LENLVKNFLSQKNFAVVGSFRNKSKYAYRIFKTLKEKGYQVYPINPGISEVEGVRCYSNVKDISETIDVISIVTPAKITANIVKDCKDIGITKVWIQPGAESKEVIKFCYDNNIDVVHGLCVMMEEIKNRRTND